MKKFSPSMQIILIALVTLLVPKVEAMSFDIATQEAEQTRCMQMMAENQTQHTEIKQSMDCCDECECLMLSCSNSFALAFINASFTLKPAAQSFISQSSIYFNPVQYFFKPPKIV